MRGKKGARCPHCQELLDAHEHEAEQRARAKNNIENTIADLAIDKIPWMWETDLPYSNNYVRGSVWYDGPRPVILRGSRWAIRNRNTPGTRYIDFVLRAARRFRLTVLPQRFGNERQQTKDEKVLDRILQRARLLAPNSRTSAPNFYIEGRPLWRTENSAEWDTFITAGEQLARMEGIT